MKKYLISGFNTVQDVKLEVGTYTLVAYVKSMHGDVYTFALGDGTDWEEFSIDVVQGQLCKVWLTFTIDKKATKFKPIANNFSESLPVYVADLQLTRGNIPVESGASPFDIDQILNDLHDEIDAIEDFTEGAFLDGLLSREEKTQLRASLDSIGAIVKSVEGSYDKLLDNPFIHENTMDSITARYYAFIASWISDGDPRGLKPVILWIVNGDNIVDQNERDEKDRALNAFNLALYEYNQAEKEVYNDVGENSIAPIIDENGMWAFWDSELQEFVSSDFSAEGDDGHSPYVDVLTGTWWEWSPELGKYKDTFIKAEGEDGQDGTDGEDGIDGEDAVAPIIIDGFWAFWNKETETFIPSEFSAIGDDGHAPIIRDGYWYEWNPESAEEDKYENTGVRAEGVKGDGVQQKFFYSAIKPERPTGDALGWVDIPDEFDIPLGAIGENLHSKSYLISLGWQSFATNVEANNYVPDYIIDSSKFKPNTQYLLEYDMYGETPDPYLRVKVVYDDGTFEYSPDIIKSKQFTLTTAIGKTVQSIEITKKFYTSIRDISSVREYGEVGIEDGGGYVWITTRTTVDGVESVWSDPMKWTGADGKDGKDGEKGKDGTGVALKPAVDSKNLLPSTNNSLGDARIVQDTGHLWVYDGVSRVSGATDGWADAGEFKGEKGDTPYIGGNGNWWIGGTDTGIKATGPKGDKGDKGDDGKDGADGNDGEDGTSVSIKGSKDTPSELSEVSNPALGDGYMINGDLWVYDGASSTPPAPFGWTNVGRIKGEKGKDGSSYLVLGYWSPDYEYQQTDAGIPIVKRPGSATFLAYKLIVPKSTVGQFINTGTNKEWELVDSSEFTYMLEAYIEVLQAELITAEKIEALDITARKLKTPSTVVTTANFQSQLIQANSVIIQDKGSTPVTYDWNTVYLPNGEQYDGLKAQIYAPTGTYKRIRIKTSDGGLLFINNTEVAVGKIELAFTTMATIHLTAMWNPTHNVLDWIITHYQIYRISNAAQTNQKRLPVILWSGDNLFSGTIPKSGVLPTDSLGVLTTINSNWLRGFTCSKNSGNMYSIKINTPFHYGASSSVSPRQTITSGDIEVSINPSNTSPINTYIAVYGQYEYTEIRVWFSNPSTPSTYIEQDFAITVRANRPIVQDEYLTSTID